MTHNRLKVLDLSTHISGSMASRILAHLEADVIKIENPGPGDGNRANTPYIHGESAYHLALNAGKRSVALDWKHPDWESVLTKLVSWADIVVYGGLVGAAKRRGLDFDAMVERNPRIVYCLITGYGSVGPWHNLPSHGLNTDVYAGSVPLEEHDGQLRPRTDYRSVGTSLAGIYAAIGVLEAVRRRDNGEGPQNVSVSVWQSAMAWQWRDLVSLANLGTPAEAYSDLGARYSAYRTADDRVILICPIEKKYWQAFCDVAGMPAPYRDKGQWSETGIDFGRDDEAERGLIAERILTAPRAEWVARFEESGVPFSPFLTIAEALASEQATATRVMATTTVNGHQIFVPNIPIGISTPGQPDAASLPPEAVSPAPALGENTDSIVKSLLQDLR